jgi:hypothetical protein
VVSAVGTMGEAVPSVRWISGLVRGPDHLVDRRDGAAVGVKGRSEEADNSSLARQPGQYESPPLTGGGFVQLPPEYVLVGGHDFAGDADGAVQGLGVRCFVVGLAFAFGVQGYRGWLGRDRARFVLRLAGSGGVGRGEQEEDDEEKKRKAKRQRSPVEGSRDTHDQTSSLMEGDRPLDPMSVTPALQTVNAGGRSSPNQRSACNYRRSLSSLRLRLTEHSKLIDRGRAAIALGGKCCVSRRWLFLAEALEATPLTYGLPVTI